MPESSIAELRPVRSVKAGALAGRFPALNANRSRPQTARDFIPCVTFVAAAAFVQLSPGSPSAGVCETPMLLSNGSSGRVAGMQATELTDGNLYLFAAPDGVSLIAGWVLSSTVSGHSAFPCGVLLDDCLVASRSSDPFHGRLPGSASSCSEIQPERFRKFDHECRGASTPCGESSNPQFQSRVGDTCETAAVDRGAFCPNHRDGLGPSSGTIDLHTDPEHLRTSPTSGPDDQNGAPDVEPPTPGNSSGSQLLEKTSSDSFWFAVGSQDAPAAYAFLDPGCPYSAKAILALRSEVEGGRLQLRIVPVSGASARSSDLVAGVLGHNDPPAAFWEHMLGMGASDRSELEPRDFESLNPAMRAAVEWNNDLLAAARIPGVPFFVFRSAHGVQTFVGVPKAVSFSDAL